MRVRLSQRMLASSREVTRPEPKFPGSSSEAMWHPQSITLGALVQGRLISPAALPLSRFQ